MLHVHVTGHGFSVDLSEVSDVDRAAFQREFHVSLDVALDGITRAVSYLAWRDLTRKGVTELGYEAFMDEVTRCDDGG